jgi:hypothetical protein
MGKVFRDHFNYNLRPHLSQYLDYVQQDIGMPPDRQRAAELANKLNVDIYIVDPDGSWSSNGKALDYPALEMEHRFRQNSIDYGTTRLKSHEVFVARSGDTTLYFDVPNLHPERKGRGWTPMLVMLFVLFLLYYPTHDPAYRQTENRSAAFRPGRVGLSHRDQAPGRAGRVGEQLQ